MPAPQSETDSPADGDRDALAALLADGNGAEIRQTHISVVYLTPQAAFKRLKPVRFEFLDFSTRASRYLRLCDEMRLNRRLAGDVYGGLAPIWKAGGGWSPTGHGAPDDWLLKMRRLPDDATMAAALGTGRLREPDLDAVADRLVAFYEQADVSPAVAAFGDPATLRVNLTENHDVLDAAAEAGAFDAGLAALLRSRQLQALERVSAEVRERMAAGYVREVHGDLRAEHVYLLPDGPPRILDCIAFNRRLRCVDVADDLAFLLTDLARLGGARFADRLLKRYRDCSGDPVSDGLLAFFRSYRGAVRAKVGLLRAGEQAGAERAASLIEAAGYARRAADELADGRPWLVAVCGLSGSGKSTVAAALAERLGAVRLSSDRLRKEIHGMPENGSGPKWLYEPAASLKTYGELLARTERRLTAGVGVVLDATFLRRQERDDVCELGRRLDARPLFVECRCDDAEAERRLTHRVGDASDADAAVRRRQAAGSDGFAGLPTDDHLVVQTHQAGAGADATTANLLGEIVSRLVAR